jgi:hypothetical protein
MFPSIPTGCAGDGITASYVQPPPGHGKDFRMEVIHLVTVMHKNTPHGFRIFFKKLKQMLDVMQNS